MNIGEKWKSSLLNKWLVFKGDNGDIHYFHPVRLHATWTSREKAYASKNLYNLYYALETDGSIWSFSYWKSASASIKYWGKCSMLNDKTVLKKLRKRMTKILLRDDEEDTKNASGFIERIFEDEDRV